MFPLFMIASFFAGALLLAGCDTSVSNAVGEHTGINVGMQNVFVTFYGYDDNDDGNGHYGTAEISHPSVHLIATEDLGTYDQPSTFATDERIVAPGTRIYVPRLHKYYVMEDTCRECTDDANKGKQHVDLYIGGNTQLQGQPLKQCETALTAEPFTDVIILNPISGLPVQAPVLFDNGACNTQSFAVSTDARQLGAVPGRALRGGASQYQ